jgi:hypothetical protein
MTTVCNLARQSACISLLKITRAIFSVLTRADIRVKAVHIPGISNTLADGLSRLDLAGDYELTMEAYTRGIRALGVTPTVDCFATSANRKCPRFFAPSFNANATGAAAINGLDQPWSSEVLPYCHPPIALIPRVLQKIKDENCAVVMVLPYWTTHSWWSSILSMIHRPILLGDADIVLKRGPTMDPRTSKLPRGQMLMCLLSPPQ